MYRDGRFCVECGEFAARLVLLVEEDGRPHAEPGHERRYLRVSLSQCTACAVGLLERDTHDCTNPAESLDRIERGAVWSAEMERLAEAAQDCPRPYDARCGCPLHQAVRASLKPVWPKPAPGRTPRESRCPRIRISWKEGLPRLAFGR